jgi:site-specific recombinase XerD
LTLSQAIEQCLTWLGGPQHYSAGTVEQYGRTYRQYLHHLTTVGKRDEIRSFTGETVLSFTNDLSKRGVSSNTIISKLGALSTLAQFCMALKDDRSRPRLTENPARAFPWPEPVKTETKFMHPAELQRFQDVAIEPHVRLAADLLLGTGIRVSEACAANVGDMVEIDGRHFLLIRVKGRKRRGEERQSVPLGPELARMVQDAVLTRGAIDPGAPLLVNRSGRRWSRTWLSDTIAAVGRLAEVKRLRVSAHKLRHTSNVISRVAGIDPLTRSKMLTHSDPRAQARYDHLLPGEVYEARLRQQAALQRYIGKRKDQ